jgi:LytS/YehU family sensor histidine kinase
MKERYFLFTLYFFYTLVGSLFLEMMIAILTFILVAEVRIQDMSPASIDIFFLLTSLLMVVFFGAAIKMLLHWRNSKEAYQKLMRERVESELRFLKTQLNPHFLFNTLNNLYYLAQEKSDKTPQAILALSEILDYVMHSGQNVFVSLKKEWQQAENYINLELLRYEDRVEIRNELLVDFENHTIGPMMLLTLLENAFKHGVMSTAGKSRITIIIQGNEKMVSITIRNTKHASKKGNGIGLANLRNQLLHLYPEKYLLQIDDADPDFFSVNLILKK